PFHVSSVPVPSSVTKPTPVTTTLLFSKITTSYLRFRKVILNVFDRVLHRGDFLRLFVGNLESESFFQRHHQLDRVEGVGAKIVNEGCGRSDFGLIDTELLT